MKLASGRRFTPRPGVWPLLALTAGLSGCPAGSSLLPAWAAQAAPAQAASPPSPASPASAPSDQAPTSGDASPVDPGLPPRSVPWERLAGMFQSAADTRRLEKVLSEPARPRLPRPIEADLHLQAIVYVDTHNWVVWINGRALRSGHEHGSLRLLSVTPQEVRLTAEHGDPGSALPEITLRPMQSYLTATGRVVDRYAAVLPPPSSLP